MVSVLFLAGEGKCVTNALHADAVFLKFHNCVPFPFGHCCCRCAVNSYVTEISRYEVFGQHFVNIPFIRLNLRFG